MQAGQRLFISYLTLIAAVVASLTLATEFALRRHLIDVVAGSMGRELALATAIFDRRADLPADSLADALGALTTHRVTIIARDGRVVGDSRLDGAGLRGAENHGSRPEVRAALGGGVGRAMRTSGTAGARLLYLASATERGEVIRLAIPLQEIDATLSRVRQAIFGVGIAALFIATLFLLAFSMAVTRPLRRASAAARAMAAGDLSLRIDAPRRDELGELAEALNTLATELQRRLAQLEGERAETQALVDAMSEGVLALGPGGVLRRANPAARRMFSLPADPRGMMPEEVSRRASFREVVARVAAGEPVAPTELSHDGRSLLATAHPLAHGGAVVVFLDVSELRRLEEVRRDFVANASHELKTPLTAIRGFAETLMDEEIPSELRRDFTRKVQSNAHRLQRIIDDLLDLSRLESGAWHVNPEPLSISEVARESWTAVAGEAERRAVDFSAESEPGCDLVMADPSALQQVFANLLANALRYTPPGGSIAVVSRPAPTPLPATEGRRALRTAPAPGEVEGWVEVAVRDSGTGIPAAYLPRIFERFYRVDAARSRAEGGTGLGLSIVRHLVESHGGEVEAESELGRGTTVRFTLPTGVITAALLGLALLLAPFAPAGAQEARDTAVIRTGAAELELSGRVQLQLTTTSVETQPSAEWALRRVRLEAKVKINELVSGKIQPEFAGNNVTLKDAYIQLSFSPSLVLTLGQMNRPFGIIQPLSSTRILPIERGVRIRGLAGALDENNLLVQLGYADRDVGMEVRGAPKGAPLGISYAAGIFNGPARGDAGAEDTYQWVARAVARPSPRLAVGAGYSDRDFLRYQTDQPDVFGLERGGAWEVDAEYGSFAPGLHLIAEIAGGKLEPALGNDFLAAQGWLAFRTRPLSLTVTALEPVLRISHGDPDLHPTAESVRGGTLLTPGVNLYLGGLNRVMLNYDLWIPKDAPTVRSLKAMFQLVF